MVRVSSMAAGLSPRSVSRSSRCGSSCHFGSGPRGSPSNAAGGVAWRSASARPASRASVWENRPRTWWSLRSRALGIASRTSAPTVLS